MLTASVCFSRSDSAKDKPNIIIIMADDHSSNAISCYGSSLIKTPNIDRLAGEGMRFTNMFVTNSLCAPSRAVIISGKYSHINGVTTNEVPLNFEQSNLPEQLSKAGYETSVIGKWHLTVKPLYFSYYKVFPFQGQFYDCKFKETGKQWFNGKEGGITVPGYLTDVITDLSINWLENKRDSTKPFCLMVNHKAPHSPHDPPEKYKELFKNKIFREPYTLYDSLNGKAIQEILDTLVNSRLEICILPEYQPLVKKYEGKRNEATKIIYQEFLKGYLRLVTSLDDNVGRLLKYLEENGLERNTIVIYTSDNGFFLGEHGLYNKMLMYEPSMKIPFIIRYPGKIKNGLVNNSMCSLIDLAPTLLDFAGADIPEDMDGITMRPVIETNKQNHRKIIYYHYYQNYFLPEILGVRTGRHKLIHYPSSDISIKWEQYDMKKDSLETKNIWMKNKRISLKLKQYLKEQIKKYNDDITILPIDISNI